MIRFDLHIVSQSYTEPTPNKSYSWLNIIRHGYNPGTQTEQSSQALQALPVHPTSAAQGTGRQHSAVSFVAEMNQLPGLLNGVVQIV